MSLVNLSHVTKAYGAETVLQDISFRLERGDRAALVGPNGAGKSTLLRLIAGLDEPDSGTITRARNLRVAYLPQDVAFEQEATLFDAMQEVFAEALAAQERLQQLEHDLTTQVDDSTLVAEYGRLQALVEHAGYDVHAQIERVLTGLGLPESLWHEPIENLSGGQRTRANLARTLLRDANLLLLDEPTNHLDIAAVEWLEQYLQGMKRAYLLVAHDRYLLDATTARTIEVSNHRVAVYPAPYSRYVELRTERRERQRQEYDAQQQKIAATEDFIRRYGAGQRSKEARGRQKQLDRLERVERPQEDAALHLRLGKPTRTGDVALEVRQLVVGYDQTPLLRLPTEVDVRRGEKIALIGPNGSGKTTLLRVLIGQLPPVSGSVRWGANTAVGYYSQSLADLDDDRTIVEEIQRIKAWDEGEVRTFLGRLLFSGDDVFKQIRMLSGGERSRVALARLILGEPNVLILDEPTNHLDIASRDALRDLLHEFAGTLLFVSHDRALIDALAHQLWVVADGRMRRFAGTYSAYSSGEATALDPDPAMDKRTPRQPEGPPDARLQTLTPEITALAGQLAEIGPSASLPQLREWTAQLAELQTELAEAQEAWLRQLRKKLHASSG